MKKKISRILYASFVLILTGCVKNSPSEEQELPSINQTEGMSLTARIFNDRISVSEDNEVSLEYNLDIKNVEGQMRIYLIVDGILNEFSLNESEYGLYHDFNIGENIDIKVKVKPHVRSNTREKTSIVPYLFATQDIKNFDDHLYSYYNPGSLEFTDPFKLTAQKYSEQVFVEPTFKRKIEKNDIEDLMTELDDYIELTKSKPSFEISTVRKFRNRVGFNGINANLNDELYLTKVGDGNSFVYPLINGEPVYQNDKILAYHFSQTSDEILFSSITNLELKKGDVLSLIVWNENSDDQNIENGFIMVGEK